MTESTKKGPDMTDRFTITADPSGAQTAFWSATNRDEAVKCFGEAQGSVFYHGGLVTLYDGSEVVKSVIVEGASK